MGIRRYAADGFSGYGVLGTTYTDPLPLYEVSLREDAFAAWQLYKSLAPSDFPKFACMVAMRWRFSVESFAFNADIHKQYNNRIGKSRIATSLVKAYDYVIDEVLVSYAKFKSPQYWGAFRFVGDDEGDDNIPCDEPQLDVPTLFFGNGGAMFYSGDAPASKEIPGSWYGYPNSNIGDSVIVAMEPSVAAFTIGATYVYRLFPYFADGWLNEGVPPLVVV